MLRWLRFALYAILTGAVLARNAGPIRESLRLVSSEGTWAPGAVCIPCALGLLAACAAYLVWLAGATVAGWRMPALSHLVPLVLLALVLWRGPLASREDRWSGLGPADRALVAMRAVRDGLLSGRQGPCAAAPALMERLLSGGEVPPSGFRARGAALPFRVQVEALERNPVSEPRAGARPGTLYLSCDGSGRRFFLTAVVLEPLPEGEPAMVRDGVGRPVVMTEEVDR